MQCVSRVQLGLPAFGFDCVRAQEAQKDFGVGATVFRVVFEPGTLEVLDCVVFAVGGTTLCDFFGDGVAKDREAAVVVPLSEEGVVEGMACFGEVEMVSLRLERLNAGKYSPVCHVNSQSAQQNVVRRSVFGV